MSIVANKSKKIVRSAIKDLSQKENTTTQEVQLLVKYYEGKPEFFGLRDFDKDLGHLPLHILYPAHMDLFGIRNQIPIFLANLIDEVTQEFEIEPLKVNIIISEVDSKGTLIVLAYNEQKKLLKHFEWKNVFSQLDEGLKAPAYKDFIRFRHFLINLPILIKSASTLSLK